MRVGLRGELRVSAPMGTPKELIEKFIESHRDWIGKARDRVEDVQTRRRTFYDQLPLNTPQQRSVALDRLNAIIPPLVKNYAAQMGVKPSGIGYKAVISKWGSCDIRTRRIMFSAYLLLLPDWCIESVVVHELTHLIVPNHSPRFYEVMSRYFPRWAEAKAEIKRISRMKAQ